MLYRFVNVKLREYMRIYSYISRGHLLYIVLSCRACAGARPTLWSPRARHIVTSTSNLISVRRHFNSPLSPLPALYLHIDTTFTWLTYSSCDWLAICPCRKLVSYNLQNLKQDVDLHWQVEKSNNKLNNIEYIELHMTPVKIGRIKPKLGGGGAELGLPHLSALRYATLRYNTLR